MGQEVINLLFMDDLDNDTTLLIPTTLLLTTALPMDSEHYMMLMAHPVTGETISSYKKLMKDPVQTAFGKDF